MLAGRFLLKLAEVCPPGPREWREPLATNGIGLEQPSLRFGTVVSDGIPSLDETFLLPLRLLLTLWGDGESSQSAAIPRLKSSLEDLHAKGPFVI